MFFHYTFIMKDFLLKSSLITVKTERYFGQFAKETDYPTIYSKTYPLKNKRESFTMFKQNILNILIFN